MPPSFFCDTRMYSETASFFSTTLVEPPPVFDLVGLYIPTNPFASLADNVVPAEARIRVDVRVETADELARRWSADEPFWIIVERGMREEFHATVGASVAPSVEADIGSNHAALFANGAAHQATRRGVASHSALRRIVSGRTHSARTLAPSRRAVRAASIAVLPPPITTTSRPSCGARSTAGASAIRSS